MRKSGKALVVTPRRPFALAQVQRSLFTPSLFFPTRRIPPLSSHSSASNSKHARLHAHVDRSETGGNGEGVYRRRIGDEQAEERRSPRRQRRCCCSCSSLDAHLPRRAR